MIKMAGVGSVVVGCVIAVFLTTGTNHLLLGRPSVSGGEFLQRGRVHEFGLRQVEFIADLQQDTPQLRKAAQVVEVAVHCHVLGYNPTDAVTADKGHEHDAERAVHLVAVAAFRLREVPRPALMLAVIAGLGCHIQRQNLFAADVIRYAILHAP